ncbi:MAG TPA: glycosyltransferase family A protein [Candidatus Methylacidiphilales bacterium]|jgi:glycosyltransferase involved in cell wall biosynthesis|nr:glycosyltransferase family A protein [Candidatus Methylacidiphilales bacterium]
MSKVTILIPTAKRPEYLETALRSVSEQTALRDVVEVIVSESAGDPRSGEVCKRFPHLPIQYILRDPQLQMTEHFSALKKAEWKGDLAAILHDDDWWAPDYLRQAIDTLSAHPRSSVYCCCSYYVAGESSMLACGGNLCFWFGADYPPIQPVWELSQEAVLLGTLLSTPVHYSAMVCRADALLKASAVYDTANWFDADRMITYELSRFGTIAFSPLPYSFYRLHANQLTEHFALARRNERVAMTTEWIIERSGESWESAGDLFSERVKRCPPSARVALHLTAMEPWCLPVMARHAIPSSKIAQLYRSLLRQKPSLAKKMAKSISPPALWEGAKFLRRKIGKSAT